jgi:hypothetical protein
VQTNVSANTVVAIFNATAIFAETPVNTQHLTLAFWEVTSCGLVSGYGPSTLKMKTVYFSETFGTYLIIYTPSTRRFFPTGTTRRPYQIALFILHSLKKFFFVETEIISSRWSRKYA